MAKSDLRDEMSEFQRSKGKLASVLIAGGILGLFLPILPGIAMIVLGAALLFPRKGNDLLTAVRKFFNFSR